jgi:hypothetical protein
MTFEEVLDQAIVMLQRRGRLTAPSSCTASSMTSTWRPSRGFDTIALREAKALLDVLVEGHT